MTNLPTGTVTFLFSDIEGSTLLLRALGDRYAEVLSDSRSLTRAALEGSNGREVDSSGDAFFIAFPRARDALTAAVMIQRAHLGHRWPKGASVAVRMGLHTGEPLVTQTGYVGIDVHRAARICAAAHGGQILLSDATSALLANDLPDDLALRDIGKHRLKDLVQPQHLFQIVAPDLPADFQPLKSLDNHPNNLSADLTSFIGRTNEIAEIKRLLASSRLLTLTGSGGAGKTRLATNAASEMLEQFADGVWLVELAGLSDPALIPQAVASALSVSEQRGRPLIETLVDYLRSKSLLLVLDNCEHLLVACSELVGLLLRAASSVRILTTSRERLGTAGEVSFRAPPFSLPDAQGVLSQRVLMQYEASRLFIERATSVQPGFRVMDTDAHEIVKICARLDGLPLAIELAAARSNVLSAADICDRLDDQFRLLTGGSRAALARHRTLRAVIDWSYDLLSETERTMLRRLSVFVAGWTLGAAEDICSDAGVGKADVLDLVARLVDKSLVVAQTQGREARYLLLETVRQYSQERLLDAGEANTTRDSHLKYFLKLAEQAEPLLQGADVLIWSERLETENDNIRTALHWSLSGGDPEAGLRLVGALTYFWRIRGYVSEGSRWFEHMLSRPHGNNHIAWARAYFGAGWLAWWKGETARATELTEKALRIFRDLGSKWGIARSLQEIGYHSYARGDYDLAASLAAESLALARELGDRYVIGYSLFIQATLSERSGDDVRAAALYSECLAVRREIGHKFGMAASLRGLGRVALRQGDYTEARQVYNESLALGQEQKDTSAVAPALEGLAALALAEGAPEQSARLLGAAEGLREAVGVPPLAFERESYENSAKTLSAMLDVKTLSTLRAEGRAMTLVQVVTSAFANWR